MNKTRQAVETVNFRLYFKVIIKQNETQYFKLPYMSNIDDLIQVEKRYF